MATLVLSAAGAALGGPLGSAVGSFVGRQIDQSFARRASPRVTDLRVPSSQYGDPIPLVLGRMRVTGVVLWSAKPVATATVSKSGTNQGSSVSFAYALSAGPIERVIRIWADGKLIRDADGRQEVSFELRLHKGDEDQLSDPLIASALGEDQAPAFRGIAYLVFENFDLSSFGNRLPLITVEVVGQTDPLLAEEVLQRALEVRGQAGPDSHEIEGYALTGDDRASAVGPIVEAFETAFAYGGGDWTLPSSTGSHLIEDDIWVLGEEESSKLRSLRETPTRVSLRYFDPAIEYAASEKSARLPGQERLRRIELPAAMSAPRAKAAAFEQLAKAAQAGRELWLRLPLSFADVEVGEQVSSVRTPMQRHRVCEKVVDEKGVSLRLSEDRRSIAPLQSEPGGVAAAAALGRSPLTVALVELAGASSSGEFEIAVLVAGGHEPFQPLPISLTMDGFEQDAASASRPSASGTLLSPLARGPADLIDRRNVIEVSFDRDPMLLSCDEAALFAGANLACVGGEFIQFATAEPLGEGRYRLSDLSRSRFDSERPEAHLTGTRLHLLEPGTYNIVRVPRDRTGATLVADVRGPDGITASANLMVSGHAARPWAPDHIALFEDASGLSITWVRRCKEGAVWLDGVDAPLGASRELYRTTLSGVAGVIVETESASSQVHFSNQSLASLGPRPWRFEVQQLGDFAAGNIRTHFID